MKVIAHRGIWKKASEKNSLEALLSAISSGFGIETDIRDLGGKLVISHDPPKKGCLELEKLLSEAEKDANFRKVIFALNIKADGLDSELERALGEYGLGGNSFFFDMSVPTLYNFSKKFPKENLCTRISDVEPTPLLVEKCGWIWVDCFSRDWSDWKALNRMKKKLAFVSPELHGRDGGKFWGELKKFEKNRECYICTDFPGEAERWFG